MANTFNCPSCGGPLEIEGDKTSIGCKYCGDTVAVPEEFRLHSAVAPRAPVNAGFISTESAEEPVVVPAANNYYVLALGIIIFVGIILFFVGVSRGRTPAPRPTDPGDVSPSGSNAFIDFLATKEAARVATAQADESTRQRAGTATELAFSAAQTLTATYEPETLDSHRVYSPVISVPPGVRIFEPLMYKFFAAKHQSPSIASACAATLAANLQPQMAAETPRLCPSAPPWN